MTCMPASRRPRATTLMPRSWPSRPTLARTTRIGAVLGAMRGASSSFKEPMNHDPEIAKDLRKEKFLVCREDPGRVVGGIHKSRFRARVEHANHQDPGVEVFGDLADDLVPLIARRKHFKYQVRCD